MSINTATPKQTSRRANSLIWLGETDPQGRPIHPEIRELAYKKETDLIQYRASEMTDDAEVASLLEEAVYRTSRAAYRSQMSKPSGYLFLTYKRLVDQTLRRTVKALSVEEQILEGLPSSENAESELVRALTRERVFESMDAQERALWKRRLLGYDLAELAESEAQSPDYVGKPLRRSTERALRRLLTRKGT